MSVPPPGYPMPPPRKSGFTGWHAAGIGCLAIFLLVLVGGVVAVRSFKNQLTHPDKSSPLGIGIIAGKAGMDGARLRQAIVAYHQEKGEYPKSLMQLVSEGRVDGKMLHNDLDSSANPGHVSWRYVKPAPNAPGSTPVLIEPYQITMGGSSQSSRIVITLDGRSQTGANAATGSQEP